MRQNKRSLRHVRPIGLSLLFVALLTSTPIIEGCRKAPPSLTTPQGKVAYQIEDAVAAIGAIQHAVIEAAHANVVARPTALKVTRATRAMAKTLDTAIDSGTGTVAVYRDVGVALAQLAADPDLVRFKPEITAAQTIIAALAGGVQ